MPLANVSQHVEEEDDKANDNINRDSLLTSVKESQVGEFPKEIVEAPQIIEVEQI